MSATRISRAIRSAAKTMTTPLLPDDYTSLLNPLWSERELRGRIEQVIPETDDAVTIVIRPGWGWRFEHLAGQFLGIAVQVDGRWIWRSYSLTSPPSSDDDRQLLTITVKAMAEGRLSSHLVRGVQPGTVIRLARPAGEFVLPDPAPERILFWTGGSGVTPVMAMLRTLQRRGAQPDIVHLHSAPTAAAWLFRDELESLASAVGANYRLVANLDDRDGRFEVAALDAVCADWRDRQAWVCGPAAMLAAAEGHWTAAGVDDALHVERFVPEGFAAVTGNAGGSVRFANSGREVTVDGATTLLEAGEGQGVGMPYGCRMGICHTCSVRLIDGAVVNLRNGEQQSQPGELVQTCISTSAGACTLDI